MTLVTAVVHRKIFVHPSRRRDLSKPNSTTKPEATPIKLMLKAWPASR